VFLPLIIGFVAVVVLTLLIGRAVSSSERKDTGEHH
jgi:hypothetical protein